MFIPFLYELRARKVPVGAQEAVALAQALVGGLHDSSLEGFYFVARSLLVHDEKHLDAFDLAFAKHFKGIEGAGLQLTAELLFWLKEAAGRDDLTPMEKQLLEAMDPQALAQLLAERQRQQKERHDFGNRWVGTRGGSRLGHSGREGTRGTRVAGEGMHRSAVDLAGERRFEAYRDDVLLDTRQLTMALRKLKAFVREGQADELDLDGTIDRTARNLGELDLALRPPRKPDTRVLLLMDVGGSMDPFTRLVSRLFSAARQATHFKELRTYYFHNCIYGRVYAQATFRDPLPVSRLLSETDRRTKLIVVGDALMAPYELFSRSGFDEDGGLDGLSWLVRLSQHYPAAAWLNPEPPQGWWQQTIEVISSIFPMYPLTLEGLGQAVHQLSRTR